MKKQILKPSFYIVSKTPTAESWGAGGLTLPEVTVDGFPLYSRYIQWVEYR